MENIEDFSALIEQQEKILLNYEKNGYAKTLATQSYEKLSKLKTKFTDELFPPNMGSFYALRTEKEIAKEKLNDYNSKKEYKVQNLISSI